MTTITLTKLVADARALANDHPCKSVGHSWETDGGRSCPSFDWVNCSQPVYRCTRCGEHDYGDSGGPGHRHCTTECPHRP